jgi:hypothetical protein
VRKPSAAKIYVIVVNPTGRNQSKSASKHIKITDRIDITFGFLTKIMNIKQKRKSGKTCLLGVRPVGVSAKITNTAPIKRKTVFSNINLYFDTVSLKHLFQLLFN